MTRGCHQRLDQLAYTTAALIVHGGVQPEIRVLPGHIGIRTRGFADPEALDLTAVVLMLVLHDSRQLPAGAEDREEPVEYRLEGALPPGRVRDHLQCHSALPATRPGRQPRRAGAGAIPGRRPARIRPVC
ncbi:hypothetical protein [Streptomyces sp. NPDC001070]